MTKPIRVLHVFGNLNSGGAESRTMDIYRAIDKSKIQFDFAIHTEEECFFTKEVESLGGKIYHFPRFKGINYYSYNNAWDLFLKKHKEYKIIHGHQTSTGFIYLKKAKKYGLPLRIAHARNSNKDSIFKRYTCKLSRYYSSNMLAVSKIAGESEFGKKAVEEGIVKVIPNAIDASKYSFDPKMRTEKRIELGIQNNFVICHIGRFHQQKNHQFLLKIFKEILNKREDAKLVLIGDGSLRSEIEQQIELLGIKDSVILTGIRSDVPDLLHAMDMLLFPSLFEGLPGVVLEAQAAGLPCIISNTITDEVKITDLVKYVSLKESPLYWSEKVIELSKELNRKNTFNEIYQAGFDIKSVAQWYQNFYYSSIY